MRYTRSSARVAVLMVVCAASAIVATAAVAFKPSPARSTIPPARPTVVRQSRNLKSAKSASAVAAALTNRQLAGQRIVYSYVGLNPPPWLLARIRAGQAAGVIFFGPNISSRAQLRATIDELQQANAAGPVHAPLLMMTDQEGGLVNRLPGPPVLSERTIGASPDGQTLAAQAGSSAGANLTAAGINVDLAPVLDVYRHPGNFIDQYQRSYSMNPATSGRLGQAFISSLQQTGVAATAKHFPGLGAATTEQDTDARPVELNLSLRELRQIDEAPYRSAIAAGVRLIMLSWATYPALDPRVPAGLSPTVIGNELRSRLGFRGVTITDAIGAGGLTRFGSYGHRGLLAARAGADLLLCSATNPNATTPNGGVAVLNSLTSALARHSLSRTAAQQAAARVIELRAGFASSSGTPRRS